ncbi:MAG: ABC transporter permease [Chloroflexi bacterium]|nr:ABC transporter permease [Chloroflexota bacterium]
MDQVEQQPLAAQRRAMVPHLAPLRLFLAFMPLWATAFALAVGAVLIRLIGLNPIEAYQGLWDGAFGNANAIGVTLMQATPLTLAGLGVLFAFRAGLWNIGAEGQLYAGATAATLIALNFPGLPSFVHIPLAMLAGFIAGAIWAGIPGYLKARRGVNEIISTLMLNYVAINAVNWLVRGPLQEPQRYFPQTIPIQRSAELPILLPDSQLHAGIIVALAAAFIVHMILWRTTLGFQVRAVGAGPSAAHYAGINVARSIILTMAISGGLAGLAGTNEILGVQHRLRDTFSPGYGYDGIVVALLGQLQPAGVILASLFFGSLRSGASMMQRTAQVPVTLVYIIQGLVVLLVVGTYVIQQLPKWSRRRRQ